MRTALLLGYRQVERPHPVRHDVPRLLGTGLDGREAARLYAQI